MDILEIGVRTGGKPNRVCGACGLEQGSNWSKHWKTRHPATNKRDWTELQDKGPTEPQWVQKPEGPHDKVFAGGQYQFWPEKRRAMLLDSFLEQGMVRFCFRDILWEMCKEKTINPSKIFQVYWGLKSEKQAEQQKKGATQVQKAIDGLPTIVLLK